MTATRRRMESALIGLALGASLLAALSHGIRESPLAVVMEVPIRGLGLALVGLVAGTAGFQTRPLAVHVSGEETVLTPRRRS